MISKRLHRVAVLALPAVLPLELGTATQIFGRDPYYGLTVCAEGWSVSLPGSGLTINTPAGLEGLKLADTMMIPGYEDVDATISTPVLDAICRLPVQSLGSSLIDLKLATAAKCCAPAIRRAGTGRGLCSIAARVRAIATRSYACEGTRLGHYEAVIEDILPREFPPVRAIVATPAVRTTSSAELSALLHLPSCPHYFICRAGDDSSTTGAS